MLSHESRMALRTVVSSLVILDLHLEHIVVVSRARHSLTGMSKRESRADYKSSKSLIPAS